MDLLLNDQSIHGQFHDVAEFREAILRVREMRQIAQRFGADLYCHRNLVSSRINSSTSLFEALQGFGRDEKRALMVWLTQQGPFWEEVREHGPNDWLEVDDDIVTDTAIGEAAHCAMLGIDRRLVSLSPSQWEFSPIKVTMRNNGVLSVSVDNYWEAAQLEPAVRGADRKVSSWSQLEIVARAKFRQLHFSGECFQFLDGYPFVPSAASRILSRLDTLDRLAGSVNEVGQRTAEGHQIYQDHFTGERAGFSDSSDTEKREFRAALTFPHPEVAGRDLFCPWHGKVNTPPFRIHFAWPSEGSLLYVVYVGMKRTRQ